MRTGRRLSDRQRTTRTDVNFGGVAYGHPSGLTALPTWAVTILTGLAMPFARSQISLQLYSLRAMRDAARMFAAAADAGYQAVELLATHLVAPAVTKRQLAARALVAPSAHVGLRLLRSRITQVLE